MSTNADILLDDHESSTVGPVKLLVELGINMLLDKDICGHGVLLEWTLLCDYHSVFGFVMRYVVFFGVFDRIVKTLRILLEEENVCFDLFEVFPHFFALLLLVQKAEIIKRRKGFSIFIDGQRWSILEIYKFVDVTKKAMPHGDIISFGNLLFWILVFDVKLWYFSFEDFFPFLFKAFTRHELVVFDASFKIEHGGISASEFKVNSAHLPLESFRVEAREVGGKQLNELFTDVLEFSHVVVAIELKGTVHDPAVVESGYCQGRRRHDLRGLEGISSLTLDATHPSFFYFIKIIDS